MDIKGYLLESPPLVGATFGVPTTSVGPRLASLAPSLLPSLPACSPCSQWSMETRGILCYVLGPHHFCGGKVLGSKREQAGRKESKREQAGSKREQSGSERE